MTSPDVPIRGACRCGAVTLTITAPPLLAAACHCTGCQRMTGSAFSLTLGVPSDGFAVAGEPVRGGLGTGEVHHWHCGRCKSWIYTTLEPDPGFVNVRATMLDDPARFRPLVESWTDEKLPWVETGATRSYPAFPPMEDYAALIAEYRGS